MSKLKLFSNASGNGNVTLQSPNTDSDFTVTVPTGTGALPLMKLETAKTASGTAVDFTGIPSWVKRITVMFASVSTNGGSPPLIQLGDSGGIETTGYNAYGISVTNASGFGGLASTAGFIMGNANTGTALLGGTYTLQTLDNGVTWAGSGMTCWGSSGDRITYGAGNKALSATLDRLRITTVNGTDTFDAGTINIMYEG